MRCEYCGNPISATASVCSACGAAIQRISEEQEFSSASGEMLADVLCAATGPVQEVEVLRLPIHAGTLILTSKKIRGRVRTTKALPDGRFVTRYEQLDILLGLVTSTAVVHVRPAFCDYVGFVVFFLFGVAAIWLNRLPLVLLMLAGLAYFAFRLYLRNYFYVRIGVGGNDLKIRISKAERSVARELVCAIKKEKAKYEFLAGL